MTSKADLERRVAQLEAQVQVLIGQQQMRTLPIEYPAHYPTWPTYPTITC